MLHSLPHLPLSAGVAKRREGQCGDLRNSLDELEDAHDTKKAENLDGPEDSCVLRGHKAH
jgi:hypothetical protein